MLFVEEVSKKNKELLDILRKREFNAIENGNHEEARFLLRVKHMVSRGVAMEHGDSTQHICPCCQKPMEIEHGVFCQNCGQLVR